MKYNFWNSQISTCRRNLHQSCISHLLANQAGSFNMPRLGEHLVHVLAVLLMQVVPVLLLALPGAVGRRLAPGTLQDSGLILGLLTVIV